jgi:pectate lyase
VSAGALLAALFACSSDDTPSPLPPPTNAGGGAGMQPTGSAASAGGSAGTDGSSGSGAGASSEGGSGGSQNAAEENPDPVGFSGAAGENGSTSGGAGGTGVVAGAGGAGVAGTAGGQAVGGGENVPDECDPAQIPQPSPLVGWAAVAGNGVVTTTGGGELEPVVVTDLEQFQQAVLDDEPRVVRVQGVLSPASTPVGSNKTIVGSCGAEIHGHLEIREAQNIIVRNITIVGFSAGDCALDPGFDPAEGCSSGADAITVQRNTHHVWFDHVAVRDGSDGNLDITNGANFVTVSWSKFSYTPRTDDLGSDSTGASGHRYSNLVGGTDEPDDFDDANALNVTWHHNWWADNVVERQPRVRFGQNHLFNNYYNSATTNYCVRAGIQAKVLLEGNFFDGVNDPHQFNNAADEATANISAGDTNIYQNTTNDQSTGGGGPAFTDPPYEYTLDAADGVPAAVTSGAGPQ